MEQAMQCWAQTVIQFLSQHYTIPMITVKAVHHVMQTLQHSCNSLLLWNAMVFHQELQQHQDTLYITSREQNRIAIWGIAFSHHLKLNQLLMLFNALGDETRGMQKLLWASLLPIDYVWAFNWYFFSAWNSFSGTLNSVDVQTVSVQTP